MHSYLICISKIDLLRNTALSTGSFNVINIMMVHPFHIAISCTTFNALITNTNTTLFTNALPMLYYNTVLKIMDEDTTQHFSPNNAHNSNVPCIPGHVCVWTDCNAYNGRGKLLGTLFINTSGGYVADRLVMVGHLF